MRKHRKLKILLLLLLMLVPVLTLHSGAASTVYFTSVNDTILNLSDDSMPFWQGGTLYIPHTAIDDGRMPKELGIYCSYNREKQIVTLIKSRRVMIADIAAGTIYDRDGTYYAGAAIIHGDIAFLPIESVAKYFDLQYSYTKVANGYLVRIKDDNAVLTDSAFIDAASAPMAQRYSQYEAAHQSEGKPDGTSGLNGDAAALRTAYLAFLVSDAQSGEMLLDTIGGGAAAFFFDTTALEGADDLLRHIVASGSTLALRVDASEGTKKTIDAITRANDALWAACNSKTRMLLLDNATEAVTEAIKAAGYCPVSFALDYSEAMPSAARAANAILSYADKRSSCTVMMGRDTDVKSAMTAIAATLHTNNCVLAGMNEVTVCGRG